MDWKEAYQHKIISSEQAAELVNSGDTVAFTFGREAFACGLSLAARKEELSDVKILAVTPSFDFGWYDEGWEDSFNVTSYFPTATCQEAIDHRRCDLGLFPPIYNLQPQETPDVLFTEISAPDEKGFCSFGNSLWNKKTHIKRARQAGKKVVAEINENLIRTYGDNFIHQSEIDYFVEHLSTGETPGAGGSLAGRALKDDAPFLKDIVRNVAGLINDGDTLQIGVGRTTEPLVGLGLLDGKNDIGFHTEATPPGVIRLVREGVINGKRKTLHKDTLVATSIGGSTKEEMEWVHMNPSFHLVSYEYLEDLSIISAHDNMTAINNALMIDLRGQITAESIGFKRFSLPGGQPSFVFGSVQAKNGKSITVLPASSRGRSRIVPVLPEGTAVTIPWSFSDYIVTEFGVAKLRGMNIRQRAEALIDIAHPDFREELKEAAKRIG